MKIVVVGAGIWGLWTAYQLQVAGCRVQLVEQRSPGHANSGSGGKTRLLRYVYGRDLHYIDMVCASFQEWKKVNNEGNQNLFLKTGLWWLFSQEDNSYVENSRKYLQDKGLPVASKTIKEARELYPHLSYRDINHIYFEENACVFNASLCCWAIAKKFAEVGGKVIRARVEISESKIEKQIVLRTQQGPLEADYFILACGPWTGHLFPQLFKGILSVSRQEVYFQEFNNRQRKNDGLLLHPPWLEFNEDGPMYYGIPGSNAVKISYDERSVMHDPEDFQSDIQPHIYEAAKQHLMKRMRGFQFTDAFQFRICPYDNSGDGDFIIDRHPHNSQMILLAGSSGHGFKLAPSIANIVTNHLLENCPLPRRFQLDRFSKQKSKTNQFIRGQ